MGRAKKDTTPITVRLPTPLVQELQSVNPSLITREVNKDKPKFRHGALGKYLERLIREDITKRKERQQDELLQRFSSPEKKE